MNYSLKTRSAVCIAALVAGGAAQADVTAQQVWDSWQEQMSMYAEADITVGSEEMSGGTLVVSDVSVSTSAPDVSTNYTIGEIRFTEEGGTVVITMSESYPITIMPPSDAVITLDATNSGLKMIVSGDADAMSYEMSADSVAVAFRDFVDGDVTFTGDAQIVLNDLSGNYATVKDELLTVDYDMNIASMDVLVDIQLPGGNGEYITGGGKLTGLNMVANVAMPLDVDFEDPENLKETIKYNVNTKQYDVYKTVGDKSYYTGKSYSLGEYLKKTEQADREDYYKKRSQADDNVGGFGKRGNNRPSLLDAPQALDKLFGGGLIDIQYSGMAEMNLGASWNTVRNPQLPTQQQKPPGQLVFEPKLQMNVRGSVGKYINMGINYNTDATFEFENQTKLSWQGKEDDIIKGIESVYEWQGKIETDTECQLLIKTNTQYVLQAFDKVSELHPYDVPEWLELNAEASSAYGHWLQNTLQR